MNVKWTRKSRNEYEAENGWTIKRIPPTGRGTTWQVLNAHGEWKGEFRGSITMVKW